MSDLFLLELHFPLICPTKLKTRIQLVTGDGPRRLSQTDDHDKERGGRAPLNNTLAIINLHCLVN